MSLPNSSFIRYFLSQFHRVSNPFASINCILRSYILFLLIVCISRTRYQSKPEIFPETQVNRGSDTIKFRCNGKSLSAKALSRVFSEDFGKLKKKEKTVIDPRGQFIRRWSKVFFLACLVCLIVDPLFFFLPVVNPDEFCLDTGAGVLQIALTVLRSITDLFFVINIVVRSKTAYVGPSSRVFGRGELVIDPWKISSRYLRNGFWYDFLAALPFPQVFNFFASTFKT